jgi:hypothetical protein
MSQATNWRKNRYREIMRSHGSESKRGGGVPADLRPPPRLRPSKAEMRAETDRLIAEFLEKENAPALPHDGASE